jgi:hypothetical protein
MDWILNHLQFVLAVAGALAYWLNERRKAGQEEAPPPHVSKTFDDPELAERTRKIREEIQRKIEQRARGYTQQQEAAPAVQNDAPPPVIREVVHVRSSSRLDAQRQAEILEEQAAMMERLREAEAMKTGAQKRLAFEASTADSSAQLRVQNRSNVVEDLRSPEVLRRAFIIREIIGPPVSLR